MSADKEPTISQAPPPVITALQLWNRELRSQVERNMIINTKNGIIPLRKYWQKVEYAIQNVEAFEVTKHRVIVDELIKKLEDASRYETNILHKHAATHWLRFSKRRRLNEEYALAANVRMACQQCLLIVVNTPPPAPTPQPSMN